MAAPITPPPVDTYAAINRILVRTIADVTEPTLAELTALTALDYSNCILEDSALPTMEESTFEYARRWGRRNQTQGRGTVKYQGGTLRYAYDPQGDIDDAANKAYKLLSPGRGFDVQRIGLPTEVALAADQWVRVLEIELGEQWEMPSSTDQGQQAVIMQNFYVVDERDSIERVQILA
ncbi:hypothetical protein [Nocardioides sp.]|uniref:phage tail tube protein n=1 Tax=Nocardioides sp. TaxID=35761 RepID=UPI0035167136